MIKPDKLYSFHPLAVGSTFCLLCFSVFEEVSSYLREQCIGQYVLILLLYSLSHLSTAEYPAHPGSDLPDGR